VFLTLYNQEGKKFSYTFSKTARDYRLGLGALAAGDYRYEARTTANGEAVRKTGAFTVRELVAEKLQTVANHQFASRSGGRMFPASDLRALEKTMLADEQLKPVTYTSISTAPLIELKWLFFTLLILLSTEWFVRKRYLTI
jgi:hypothetical protein